MNIEELRRILLEVENNEIGADTAIEWLGPSLTMPEPSDNTASWQPIETAPTDDTVLVFGNGCISMAYLCESGDGWKNSHNSRAFDMCRLPLTHWQPLPNNPVELAT